MHTLTRNRLDPLDFNPLASADRGTLPACPACAI